MGLADVRLELSVEPTEFVDDARVVTVLFDEDLRRDR
jgi:hypothetical protein